MVIRPGLCDAWLLAAGVSKASGWLECQLDAASQSSRWHPTLSSSPVHDVLEITNNGSRLLGHGSWPVWLIWRPWSVRRDFSVEMCFLLGNLLSAP